jgi:hypothetical protein
VNVGWQVRLYKSLSWVNLLDGSSDNLDGCGEMLADRSRSRAGCHQHQGSDRRGGGTEQVGSCTDLVRQLHRTGETVAQNR